MKNTFFDHSKEFTSSFRNHPKKLATTQLGLANAHSIVPDADDTHNVADVHLLQHCEQLVARSILAVIVETFSQNLLLLDGVHLRNTVRKNAVLRGCKFAVGFLVLDVAQVVNDETDLVLMTDCGTEGLKCQLFIRD